MWTHLNKKCCFFQVDINISLEGFFDILFKRILPFLFCFEILNDWKIKKNITVFMVRKSTKSKKNVCYRYFICSISYLVLLTEVHFLLLTLLFAVFENILVKFVCQCFCSQDLKCQSLLCRNCPWTSYKWTTYYDFL